METRSRDSFIIPLMIEENRAKFFTVSLWVTLEQGLPQGYKGLIVISRDGALDNTFASILGHPFLLPNIPLLFGKDTSVKS